MSHRPKTSHSLALFPFLAVLVCTMGALIFLLLVTTRMMRQQAVKKAIAKMVASQKQLPLMNVPAPAPVPFEPNLPDEPVVDPKAALAARTLALQAREQEQAELDQKWRGKVATLKAKRDERDRTLGQRRQLSQVAVKRVAAQQAELNELEVKLGKLTGELSVPSNANGTIRERIEVEAQIKDLKQRLQAAEDAPPSDDTVQVIPFDVISGTSRRPILIECSGAGLRFVPEDVMIKRNDLAGFTPHLNPLLVGAMALTNYWKAWNIRQPNPGKEPEPYVLLLVRPSGVFAYYVAMGMLEDLKQAHGYELIEEDTVLQMPPVDAGAKSACESAVGRLLAERNNILRQASPSAFGMSGGSGGGGNGGGSGGRGGNGGGAPGGSGTGRGGPFGDPDDAGLAGGGVAGGETGSSGAGTGGSGTAGAPASSGAGNRRSQGGTVPAGGSTTGGANNDGGFQLSDIMDSKVESGGRNWDRVENFEGSRRSRPAPNGAVAGAAASGGAATSKNSGERGSSGPEVDIGMGPSGGGTAIPVEDQRGRRKKPSTRDVPTEPEQLANHHWGVSDAHASIGLERELRIDVERDRYVIGRKVVVDVESGEKREEMFLKMVTAIDLHARDWGKPPEGFYWKPNLRYVIADGANANYERIEKQLERAGLSSTKEYAGSHEPSESKPAERTPRPVAPAPAEPKPQRRLFRGILK